jgi:predicted lipid-binding transport protein (Tim44 family)
MLLAFMLSGGTIMKKTGKNRFKLLILCITVCFLFFIGMESLAFARAGGGRSMGSRGFSSGGSYQRSTPSPQPSGTYQQSQQQTTPQGSPMQQPAPSFGRSLLYGMGGGLLGGMVGSMLFGGRGYAGGAGGWGGGGFGFGDIIILLIIAGIIYFFVKRYRARKQEMLMDTVGAGYASSPSYGYNESASGQTMQEDPVSQGLRYIKNMDPSFDENRFKELVEDIFFKIQGAWTKRDMNVVRDLLAPQMLNTFQNDVNAYIANRQFNRLENIAVRNVEIVDATQDQGEEYITIKFLASLLDYTTDETGNQVISGSSTDPVKFLEYWTFTRKTGNRNWILAGITQESDY